MLDLYESLSYLLDKCNQKSFKIFQQGLMQYGITPAQAVVLNCLFKKDGISQLELCRMSQKDRTTISGILFRLEALGFITRLTDRKDRRITLVYLTQKARDAQEGLDMEAVVLNEVLAANLTRGELDCLMTTLKKILENGAENGTEET